MIVPNPSNPFQEVVNRDRELRQRKVERHLYPLSQVQPQFTPISEAFVTLSSKKTPDSFIQNIETRTETIIQNLCVEQPVLSLLDWNGMVLAGGKLVHQVMRSKSSAQSDYDFFFYGHSEASASALIRHNIQVISHYYQNQTINITRNKYNITCQIKNPDETIQCEFQFVLRIWSTMADIVYGFDIGCCQILWDGDQSILLSELAKHAFGTTTLILDPTHNSPTYLKRLSKYHYHMGFHLVILMTQEEIQNTRIYEYQNQNQNNPLVEYNTCLYDGLHLERLWHAREASDDSKMPGEASDDSKMPGEASDGSSFQPLGFKKLTHYNYESSFSVPVVPLGAIQFFLDNTRAHPLTFGRFLSDDERIFLYQQRYSNDFWNDQLNRMWEQAQVVPGPLQFIQTDPYVHDLINSSFFPLPDMTLSELVARMKRTGMV